MKLRALGLDDCIISWINNYLAERTQVVAVDGVESDPSTSPLWHSSGLCPWTSTLLINDLPAIVEDMLSNLNLFPDDVLLYRIITCAIDYLLLQEMIRCLEQWSTANYLSFNTSKCKYMIISCKRNPPVPDVPLKLFGSPLERVDSYKYLGVLLTGDLSWSLQVELVCQKVQRILGFLYRRFYMVKHRRNH